MSHYLVTGGAGFIGSNIVHALARKGHSVRVLDNLSTGKMENLAGLDGLDFLKGDIRDASLCRKACKGVHFVLHHAAFISVPGSVENPLLTNDINVTGTLNLLEAARGAGVQRFVYASSCAVYGNAGNAPIPEEAMRRPLSPYAASKAADELFADAFADCYEMTLGGLRYFNVYGPRQDPKSPYAAVIPLFISEIFAGRSPVINGDGQQTRDFIYIDDVVRMNQLVCETPIVGHDVFNVACGKTSSINELAEVLISLAGARIKPQHGPDRHADIRHSAADISKAQMRLGFTPGFDLREGLSRTLEWFRTKK